MGRPSILIAAPEGQDTRTLGEIHDVIRGIGAHRFERASPLLYSCIKEIGEELDTRSRGALLHMMAVILLPRIAQWPIFEKMSMTINSDTFRSPLLELAYQYPEVYWVFVRHPDDTEAMEGYKAFLEKPQVSWKDHLVGIADLTRLIKNHGAGFRTLFDPTGLRAGSRWFLQEREEAQPPPIRALCIEDEGSFSLFNGYVLFRLGYSTYLASTLQETRRLLTDSSFQFRAVIEDVFLNFRDAEGWQLQAFAMLPKDEECPEQLINRRASVFETTFAVSKESLYRLVISAAVPDQPVAGVVWRTKPYGGMFSQEIKGIPTQANAKVYEGGRSGHGSGHGAVGTLQSIAEGLVRRAGEILASEGVNRSLETAVQAAVLAREARLCLGNKASSLSLTALGLQHRAEAIAECRFLGTTTGLNTTGRLKDLEESVQGILEARGVAPETTRVCEIQKLDAMMHIAMDLSSVYDDCGEFDEAELLRREVSRYQIDIQVANSAPLYGLKLEVQQAWRDCRLTEDSEGDSPREDERKGDDPRDDTTLGLASLPAICFRYYIGALLRRGRNIVFGCLAWIVLFAIIYSAGRPVEEPFRSFPHALLESGSFFVTGNPPPGSDMTKIPMFFGSAVHGTFLYQAVVFLNCLCGFVHLGVFIAYLYSKVARK